jgi:hypothetical protein
MQCDGSTIVRVMTVLRCYKQSEQLNLRVKERNMKRLSHAFLSKARLVLGRSFFPLFAITIIAGAMLWGPWVSLGITALAIAAALRLI